MVTTEFLGQILAKEFGTWPDFIEILLIIVLKKAGITLMPDSLYQTFKRNKFVVIVE